MQPILLAVITLSLSVGVAAAQGAPTQAPAHAIVVMADQVNWGPGPAALPPGAQAAVLEGDPKEAAPFTMRLSFPDGYRIPAHSHPGVERVTIIQGTFRVGMGDKFDASALTPMPVGTFIAMQPGTNHYGQAKGKTVVQITAIGPWKVNYVNRADDPRQKPQ